MTDESTTTYQKGIFAMSLPSWITRSKLERALQDFLKTDDVNIIEMATSNAVPMGDNFSSDLFRTRITYTANSSSDPEILSVIVKCVGEKASANDDQGNSILFEKECSMFSITIPKLNQIAGRVSLSAEYLAEGLEPHGYIILEDLSSFRYKTADRQKGLDMDHCFMVMEKLAILHSSSAVLYEKEPSSMDSYDHGLMTNPARDKYMKPFIMAGYKSFIAASRNWPGFEKYGVIIQENIDELYEKSVTVCKRDSSQFNVLNHGDLWTNNLLFQYDHHDTPIDLKFIDFQYSIFTTPVLDLHYFICTSLRSHIGTKHLSRLLGYYHEQLIENLKNFGYSKEKLPTYQEIFDDFRSREFFAVLCAVTILPMIKADRSDDATVKELRKHDNENGFRKLCYNCMEYRSRMEELLPYYEDLGLFNL